MLSRVYAQVLDAHMQQLGLTATQGFILGYLAERAGEEVYPRDIERTFGIKHPSVTGVLQRREAKGFIQLVPDQRDRRCKRIYILPKGAACNETMRKTIDDSEARIVAGFSPEEKTQFILFLNRAIRNLETCPGKHLQKEEKAND